MRDRGRRLLLAHCVPIDGASCAPLARRLWPQSRMRRWPERARRSLDAVGFTSSSVTALVASDDEILKTVSAIVREVVPAVSHDIRSTRTTRHASDRGSSRDRASCTRRQHPRTFSRRPAGARAANPSPSLWPLPVPTLALAARLSAQLRHVSPRVGCGVQDHVVCWVVLFRVGVVGSAVAAAAAAAAAASIFLNVSVPAHGHMCMCMYMCILFRVDVVWRHSHSCGDSERVTTVRE